MNKRAIATTQRILFIILVGVILLTTIIFYFSYFKPRSKLIKEGNNVLYNHLECISNCPVYFNETLNQKRIEQKCADNCVQNYMPSVEYQKISSGTLYSSEEIKSCGSGVGSPEDFEEYIACLKNKLPELKDKFNIQ